MWTQGDPIGKPIASSVKIVEEVQEKLSAAGEIHCMEAVGIIGVLKKYKYYLKKADGTIWCGCQTGEIVVWNSRSVSFIACICAILRMLFFSSVSLYTDSPHTLAKYGT